MRKLFGAAIVILLAACVVLWASWWRAGGNATPTAFVVEQGASVGSVAAKLEKAGLIGSGAAFRGFAKILGGGDPVQAGEFEIPPHASPATILDLLQHGRPVQRLITVPEGMPSIMVQERLAALKFAAGVVPVLAEGSVLPDSYTFERGEQRAAIAKRMTAAMDKAFDAAWAKRKGDCPVANRNQVITLASIVEKETGKASERRMVAGVYCNRLKIGMKLDADPTVIYPVTKGKPLGRKILRSELMAQNGYNTYRMAGLPAGPIANPGRESIAAVLNPESTRALYFVADGTGGHVFADTLAQHNANVAKWREIRRARGI